MPIAVNSQRLCAVFALDWADRSNRFVLHIGGKQAQRAVRGKHHAVQSGPDIGKLLARPLHIITRAPGPIRHQHHTINQRRQHHRIGRLHQRRRVDQNVVVALGQQL